MWHKTSEEKPPVHTLVIGVWEENAMKCYMKPNNMWVDYFHNSFCYTPTEMWTEDPMKTKI